MRSATVRLPGHPDAACDLIAESLMDEYVRRDPDVNLQVSVIGGRGVIFVSGDVLSAADFDVSSLVKRTMSEIGILDEHEPFVSIEPVSSARIAHVRQTFEAPVTVTGYATRETPEALPLTVVYAQQIAKRLDALRREDPDWFWLGPDAEITVLAEASVPTTGCLRLEYGSQPLEHVRSLIETACASCAPNLKFILSPVGVSEARGLREVSGASGRTHSVYGSLLPSLVNGIGREPASPQKGGAWLARAIARRLLQGGAKAIRVQLTYLPGDLIPSYIEARDERGQDVTASLDPRWAARDRVMRDWWQPGLNRACAEFGFTANPIFPWERDDALPA